MPKAEPKWRVYVTKGIWCEPEWFLLDTSGWFLLASLKAHLFLARWQMGEALITKHTPRFA